jgi:hypothetical protein
LFPRLLFLGLGGMGKTVGGIVVDPFRHTTDSSSETP